ncbi:hypothetical protein BH10BDE1_BH10BDE1_03390 [soil metagenome]
MKADRREVTVKNNPGITRIQEWSEKTAKWIDQQKFRSSRRTIIGGVHRRESGVFNNIEDAKAFRIGKLEKAETGQHHKNAPAVYDDRARFSQLLETWKAFHFLKVDHATKQTYERKLPALEAFLNDVAVDDIDSSMIDRMIGFWKSDDYPKGKARQSFEKELDALKVILNFYRKRTDPRFPIPIYREHYLASKVKTVAQTGVRSLKRPDLAKFFAALKAQKNEMYFPMALAQFCLSLRIGEVCALTWKDFDFEAMTVRIERTIVWDHDTHEARIKGCPKNGKDRVLALPEVLAKAILELKRKRSFAVDFIFHKDGEVFIRKSVANAYNRALDICGITYVRGTHLVRKTSATQANVATGDFHAVSLNLGHSSVEETKRYVEEVGEGKRKVALALNDVAVSALNQNADPL